MTEFDYYNVPDEMNVSALPEELYGPALEVIARLAVSGDVLAKEIKIAHAYDRKGYMELDTLGGHRNPSYPSPTDDLILQLTMRIKHPSSGYGRTPEAMQTAKALEALETRVKEINTEKERKALEAEIAQAEEAMRGAEKLAREKRERLAALKARK
jgi:hypothetical protein